MSHESYIFHVKEELCSHIWKSHESCRPCVSEKSRCPYVEGSRVTSSVCDQGVMSHTWMSDVTHMNHSRHTYE